MKQIPLSQGLFALVDDEDYKELSKYKWTASKSGPNVYAVRLTSILLGKRKNIYMHRSILSIDKNMVCDHINGNGLDNRRENLRQCTQRENVRRQRMRSDNTTGFKGVSFNQKSQKFLAQIAIDGKVTYIGYFNTAIEAAKAYDQAAIAHYGEFAMTNTML